MEKTVDVLPSLTPAVRATFALNIFLACTSFAIVMPSLWPYVDSLGGSRGYLAFVVASYSMGEALGAVAFGWAYDCGSPRPLLLHCIALACIGSGMYAVAIMLPRQLGLCAILSARLIQGIGSGGQQAVEQAYIGSEVPPVHRTQVTSMLSTFATLGFLTGPLMGVPLSFVDITIGSYRLNTETAPSVFICVCFAFMYLVTWVLFRPSTSRSSLLAGSLEAASLHLLTTAACDGDDASRSPMRADRFSIYGVITCMLIFFVHFSGFAIIETICTPLIATQFGWGTRESFELFAVSGGLSMLTLMLLAAVSKYCQDFHLLLCSLLVAFVGYALMIHDLQSWHGAERYIFGFMLASIAFPAGRALSLSALSKLLGNSPDQALYLGVVFAVGAIARSAGPFIAVSAEPSLLFSTTATMFGMAIIVQLSAWNNLERVERESKPGAVAAMKPRVVRQATFGRLASSGTPSSRRRRNETMSPGTPTANRVDIRVVKFVGI